MAMLLRHYLIPLFVVFLVYPALSPADSTFTTRLKPIVIAGGNITLEQAAARVKRQTGGRILSAEVSRQDGRKAYRIKVLLPSGNVRVVIVRADSH
ncbi:MAG: PepSY domain-containing protein [Acidiferrobacterales bacterium]